MNYLAHALLSPEDPYLLMGNIWGDLVRPRDYGSLHPDVMTGVQQHKSVDAFTDSHHAVDQIIRLIRPFQGKYTPVVADVLMDFMLSKFWHHFSTEAIHDFCTDKYDVVNRHLELIPDRLHPRITRMLSHRWLESCVNRERMEETLKMLSRRASFENVIPDAMRPYDLHMEEMDELFLEFFRELQLHVTLRNEG